MPEICRFSVIAIKMYYDDHNPPHFHAQYSGGEIRVDIRTLAVISGRLPARAGCGVGLAPTVPNWEKLGATA